MEYKTLIFTIGRGFARIKFNRPEARNAITQTLLTELSQAFKEAEEAEDIKVVVMEGSAEFFCMGMDFEEVAHGAQDDNIDQNAYYNILKQMTGSPTIVIAKVEGRTNAGGIGFVAASDIVISKDEAQYSLSEMLFGLLPACVMPFLARRVGIQKAQWLTLSTQPITAQRAYEIGLVDEVTENPDDSLRKNLIRLTRLEKQTIQQLKSYMQQLWMNNDDIQNLAVNTISSLMQSKKIQDNIRRYVTEGAFPWNR